MNFSRQEHEDEEPFLSIKDPEQRKELVKELHLLKTDIFMRMVESGMMPLRPGVKRLVGRSLLLSRTPDPVLLNLIRPGNRYSQANCL